MKEGKRLVEADQQPAQMHGKLRLDFLGHSGTPGNGLPSMEAPLFVKGSLCCLMAVNCPPGYDRPNFTVCACYTPTPPLQLFRTSFMRGFNWLCNLATFMCMCCIVFVEAYAAHALAVVILIILAALIILATCSHR